MLLEITVAGNKQQSALKTPDRMLSLDAFRGATIAGMILVNNPGRWSMAYAQLRHEPWNGWTFADCIFPFFLFIVGVAIVFSFSKRKESTGTGGSIIRRILCRSCTLFGLGLLLHGFPYYVLSDLRIPGVLQRIGGCYLAASIITIKTRIATQVCILGGLLISYWLILKSIPIPGVGAGSLEQGRNLASYVDGLLLSGHLWYNIRPFDPEGILSTIPAIGSTLFGVLTGHWLRSNRSIGDKVVGMLIGGILLLIVGQVLNIWLPINKGIWTSSYAVFMAGMSLICLAAFCWIFDIKGHTKAATPFVIFGRNAIAAYVVSDLLSKTIRVVELTEDDGKRVTLRRFIFDNVYTVLAGGKLGSMIFAVSFVLLTFLVVWVMWKKGWFLKV